MVKKSSINTLSDQITFLIAAELVLAVIAYSIIGILTLAILLDAAISGQLFCSYNTCLLDQSNGIGSFYLQFSVAVLSYIIAMFIGFRTIKIKWKKFKSRRILVDRFNFIMSRGHRSDVIESK